MKDESDDSGIIVYEIHDDYSVATSPKSKQKTITIKNGISVPDQKKVDSESMARLAGFSGRVYDKLTHRTIEGVFVTIAKDLSVRTDEKGMFSVVGIKPGKYRITVFEDGYVIQSCKGRAVAGETTRLESFHLIPDCLAAEYPESTTHEEEEKVDEDLVEFAMEPSRATSSEEIVCAPKVDDAKREELETEAVQPERVPENIQETVPEVVPQEFIVEEIPVETAAEVNPQAVYREELIEPATEDLSRQAVQFQEYYVQSLEEPELFLEIVSEIISYEEPPVAISLEKIQSLAMSEDFAETHISIPEEIIYEESPVVEEIPLRPVENTKAKAVQPDKNQKEIPEEAPQMRPAETSPLRQLWIMWHRKKPKEIDQKQTAEPSAGQAVELAVPFPEYEGQPLEPSMETASPAIPHEDVTEEIRQEEPPVEISPEEMQTPAMNEYLTEAAIPVSEEIIIERLPSVEKVPLSPVENTKAEAMHSEEAPPEIPVEEAPIGTIMEDTALQDIKEGPCQEPLMRTLTGEPIGQAVPPPEYREQLPGFSMETALLTIPYKHATEEIHYERPLVEDSLEDVQTPLMSEDLAETVMLPVHEEIIIEKLPFVEEAHRRPVETTKTESMQPEKASQDSADQKPRSRLPEKTVHNKKRKEQSIEPSTKVTSQTVHEGEVAGETQEEEQPIEILRKKVEAPAFTSDSAEIARSVPENILVKEKPSVEETPVEYLKTGEAKAAGSEEISQEPLATQSRTKLLWWSLRGKKLSETHREEPAKPPMEDIPQTIIQKEFSEETRAEEEPLNISHEEALKHGHVDEDSLISEEMPEDIENYDIASLSDEERAAMSSEENMVSAAGLAGAINAIPNPAFRGLPITIAYHLRNIDCDDLNDFTIRITVVNPDTGTIHETFKAPVTCAKDTFSIGGFTFSTASYEANVYTLNMHIVSRKTKSAHLLASIPFEIRNIF